MRAFIAIEIPDTFRFQVASLARRLSEQVDGRFVRPANYHITMAFLGDVGVREIGQAIAALEASCDGCEAPLLVSDGLGKFGRANDATLWLGIRPVDGLVEMGGAVRKALVDGGIAFDGKPFKPHITIARRAVIPKAALPPLPFPEPGRACAITLFKSELDPDGAVYTPIYTLDFI